MESLLAIGNVHGGNNLTFGIDLDHSTGSLFCKQRVSVGQSFTSQHLWGLADIVPDDVLLAINLSNAGGFASVGIEQMPLRKDLEHHADTWRLVFPSQLALGRNLNEPVSTRPLILCHQDAVAVHCLTGHEEGS